MVATKKAKAPKGPYCYALADQFGIVFYIGKGIRDRMYQHEKEAHRGGGGEKCQRIREILKSGGDVQYSVLGVYESHSEAFNAEREFIAAHKGLTNVRPGGGGVRDAKERICQQAVKLLAKLKPFHEWEPAIPAELRSAITNVFGSPRAAYQLFLDELTNACSHPAPTSVVVGSNGMAEFEWV